MENNKLTRDNMHSLAEAYNQVNEGIWNRDPDKGDWTNKITDRLTGDSEERRTKRRALQGRGGGEYNMRTKSGFKDIDYDPNKGTSDGNRIVAPKGGQSGTMVKGDPSSWRPMKGDTVRQNIKSRQAMRRYNQVKAADKAENERAAKENNKTETKTENKPAENKPAESKTEKKEPTFGKEGINPRTNQPYSKTPGKSTTAPTDSKSETKSEPKSEPPKSPAPAATTTTTKPETTKSTTSKPTSPAPTSKPKQTAFATGQTGRNMSNSASPLTKSVSNKPIKSSRLSSALGSVKKFKAENYDAMVRYMIGEGYATDEDSARAIVEHMSDAWVADLMG